MDEADTATYLGVIVQWNLKFDLHITAKKTKLEKLRTIKHILHTSSPKRRPVTGFHKLAQPNNGACRHVRNPTLAKENQSLEMLQHRAVRTPVRLRGRASVTQNFAYSLSNRLSLLIKMLQEEEQHSTPAVASDEITGNDQNAGCGEMKSINTASHVVYHFSFLPTSNRDTRENIDWQTKHRNCQ